MEETDQERRRERAVSGEERKRGSLPRPGNAPRTYLDLNSRQVRSEPCVHIAQRQLTFDSLESQSAVTYGRPYHTVLRANRA